MEGRLPELWRVSHMITIKEVDTTSCQSRRLTSKMVAIRRSNTKLFKTLIDNYISLVLDLVEEINTKTSLI